jgi:hypothetical protein
MSQSSTPRGSKKKNTSIQFASPALAAALGKVRSATSSRTSSPQSLPKGSKKKKDQETKDTSPRPSVGLGEHQLIQLLMAQETKHTEMQQMILQMQQMLVQQQKEMESLKKDTRQAPPSESEEEDPEEESGDEHSGAAAAAVPKKVKNTTVTTQWKPPRLTQKQVEISVLVAVDTHKDPKLLREWFFKMELAVEQQGDGVPFSEVLRIARFNWNRDVDDWWKGYCEAVKRKERTTVTSWEELQIALRGEYESKADEDEAYKEYRRLKQGSSETMEVYVARMQQLHDRISRQLVPSETFARAVLEEVDQNRFNYTKALMAAEVREYGSKHNGQGMNYTTVRLRLVELARQEPASAAAAAIPGAVQVQLDHMKQQLDQMKKTNSNTGPTPPRRQISAVGSKPAPASQEGQPQIEGSRKPYHRGSGRDGTLPPELQSLYDSEKCFNCQKTGHRARDCIEPKRQRGGRGAQPEK